MQMDSNGFKRIQGWIQKRIQRDSKEVRWIQMDSDGFRRIQMDSEGIRGIQMVSNGFQAVLKFCVYGGPLMSWSAGILIP